jgi:hypothetical protein
VSLSIEGRLDSVDENRYDPTPCDRLVNRATGGMAKRSAAMPGDGR